MGTGICKLCLAKSELINSHIIPRWVFKRIRDNESKNPNPISVSNNCVAHPDSKQYPDYLLCSDCEKKIKVFEDFASKVAYNQKSESFFTKKRNYTEIDSFSKFYLLENDLSEHLYKFGLSVIWRASVSKKIFKSIDLGETYNEISRLCLMTKSKLPENISILCYLYLKNDINDNYFPRILDRPQKIKDSSITRYYFSVCGLYFHVFVGKLITEKIKMLSINKSNRLLQTNNDRIIKKNQTIEFIYDRLKKYQS